VYGPRIDACESGETAPEKKACPFDARKTSHRSQQKETKPVELCVKSLEPRTHHTLFFSPAPNGWRTSPEWRRKNPSRRCIRSSIMALPLKARYDFFEKFICNQYGLGLFWWLAQATRQVSFWHFLFDFSFAQMQEVGILHQQRMAKTGRSQSLTLLSLSLSNFLSFLYSKFWYPDRARGVPRHRRRALPRDSRFLLWWIIPLWNTPLKGTTQDVDEAVEAANQAFSSW